jgi:hypothetical protein
MAESAPGLSRRFFIKSAAAVAASGSGSIHGLVAAPAPLISAREIAQIDRERILQAAGEYLSQSPITITASSSPRSHGGMHDYFSEGDYWWPDLKNPGGPYIRRDGYSNPANFGDHRTALIRLSLQVPALVAAWLISHDKRYARHAALHLRAWFLDPATRMNPSLDFAQAIYGVTPGRGTGIIDTLHLVEVSRAIQLLERSGALTPAEFAGVLDWFARYLSWMCNSTNGREEENARNNHGTCWVAQAAAFAALTENGDVIRLCRDRFRSDLLPDQLAANGSFPMELTRTKPYSYSLFNLDVLAIICQIASANDGSPDDLWRIALPDGRSYRKAIDFMFPFVRNKTTWPYPHDVEHFDELPNRQPSFLFAGLAYREPTYVALWRGLPPDPKAAEIIRNFPFRQPLLWVTEV